MVGEGRGDPRGTAEMERGLAALWLGIGLLLLLLVNFAAGSAEGILHTNVHHDSQGSEAVHRKELDLERSAHLKEIEDLKHKLSALGRETNSFCICHRDGCQSHVCALHLRESRSVRVGSDTPGSLGEVDCRK